jgi:hypothetical protein
VFGNGSRSANPVVVFRRRVSPADAGVSISVASSIVRLARASHPHARQIAMGGPIAQIIPETT